MSHSLEAKAKEIRDEQRLAQHSHLFLLSLALSLCSSLSFSHPIACNRFLWLQCPAEWLTNRSKQHLPEGQLERGQHQTH